MPTLRSGTRYAPKDAQAKLQAEPEGEKPFYLKESFYQVILWGFICGVIAFWTFVFLVTRSLPSDFSIPSFEAGDYFWHRAPLEDCKYPPYAFDFLAAVNSSHIPEVNSLSASLNRGDPLPDHYLQTVLFFWHPDNAQYTGLAKWQHRVIRQLYQDASDKVKAQKETAKKEAAERESGIEYDGTIAKWYTTTTTMMDDPYTKVAKPLMSLYERMLAKNTQE